MEARTMRGPARLTAAAALAAALLPAIGDAQLFTLTREQMIEYTAQNPFERFPDGRPKIPDGLLERAKGMSMEEVFAILPGKQFRNQYEGGWQVLYPKKKMVGRAVTVQFMPARPDLDAVVNAGGRISNQTALDLLQPGDVLVVDLFGKGVDATIVGDNLFYYMAKSAKAAGLVVDGAIRGLEGSWELEMPAYHRTAHPSVVTNVTITG